MKKLIIILMFGSLFANNSQTIEVVNITQNSKVEIYSALFWTPCKEAKLLLQSRGIDYSSKLITFSRTSVNEMVKKTSGKTYVPQIFVDDKYFGGLSELKDYYKEK